jgi:D-glycero-D-manno-heptose 1,7-bisphosphate phosphatase
MKTPTSGVKRLHGERAHRSGERGLPAVFLDRDGTLVHPRHYPSRPADLRLYDGLGPYLRCLQASGFRLVVITNQSGIARGYFTEADLRLMHEHLAAQLARTGVRLDGIYHCPHHPDGAIPELAVRCRCRKPQPGMVLRAAADLGLDLQHSWLVGDILDDVEAGNRAGCRTILVDLGAEPPPERSVRRPAFVARDTPHALRIITALEGLSSWSRPAHPAPAPDLTYRPPQWAAGPGPVHASAAALPTAYRLVPAGGRHGHGG